MQKFSTKSIGNHMKLFMSSLRYLHVKYEKPNRKNRQAEGRAGTNGGRKRKRIEKDNYVGSLRTYLLRIMLQGLGEGERKN